MYKKSYTELKIRIDAPAPYPRKFSETCIDSNFKFRVTFFLSHGTKPSFRSFASWACNRYLSAKHFPHLRQTWFLVPSCFEALCLLMWYAVWNRPENSVEYNVSTFCVSWKNHVTDILKSNHFGSKSEKKHILFSVWIQTWWVLAKNTMSAPKYQLFLSWDFFS